MYVINIFPVVYINLDVTQENSANPTAFFVEFWLALYWRSREHTYGMTQFKFKVDLVFLH